MSGERLIEHLIASPDPLRAMLQNYENRIVWLERDTRQLATTTSMIGVATLSDLPPIDSVPKGADGWVVDSGQKWTVTAGVWVFVGNTP